MVQFLLEEQANPYIASAVDSQLEETVLETACRWNYIKIINLYLAKFMWSEKVLKSALKLCNSNEAKNILTNAYKAVAGGSILGGMCCKSKGVKTIPRLSH
eukprot:TRINITY_DN4609_c0_g1_i1.p2 TRINITY_DN4609_c0_g1~~TRINITY_DN4609_c0_g1_i1.p2  ORF type:complete len:101 (+),score=18.93 TRINITY_DN4609_c0_g1_i1:692-994(+)